MVGRNRLPGAASKTSMRKTRKLRLGWFSPIALSYTLITHHLFLSPLHDNLEREQVCEMVLVVASYLAATHSKSVFTWHAAHGGESCVESSRSKGEEQDETTSI